jgi:hypothetical protein
VVQVGGSQAGGLGTSPEPAPDGAVIELRVHGVSGTPPEAMLADPWVARVAGDGLSGFYRRGQAGTAAAARSGGVVPEAFSWGSLTSGASARALWLLLLPFMLVNVSYWMRPRRRGQLDRLTRWLLRLLALSLTATMVLAAAGVSVDLIAWQCAAPGQRCGADRSWLRWLSTGFWSEPGRRLLVGALGPAAVITLLWYLGRRTWSSYESVLPPRRADRPDLPLGEAEFWYGRHLVGRLRAAHLAAGTIAVAGVLIGPALRADRMSHRPLLAAAGWALLAALAVHAAAVVGVLGVRRVVDRAATPQHDRWCRLARALTPLSLLLAVLAAVYVAAPGRAHWPATASLPGYATAVTALFSAQVGLLLAIAAAVWAQRRGVPAGTALRGFAAPVLAAVGLLLACAFSAGVAFRAADFLDGGGTQNQPTATAGTVLQPPSQYSWASLGFLVALGGVLVLVAGVLLTRLRGIALTRAERAYAGELRGAEPGLDPYTEDRARLRRVAQTRLAAGLTDSAPALLAALVLPGAVLTAVVTVIATLTPDPPAVLAERHLPAVAPTVSFLTNLGTWLVSGFALALLVLGRAAYRRPGLRRVVGILWDVGTFWPRGAHPLAPPCYAERAVPDLVRRASWLASPGAGRGDVLLSAHSQGTILSAAALLQMPAEALARIRLLTYGCPLHRLYARFFPAYVDATTLTRLDELLGERWTNLSRLTDPIGGPVFPGDPGRGSRIDLVLADPISFGCPPDDTVPPALRMHSDYWADAAYDTAVRALLARPVVPPTAPDPVPPPPGRRHPPAGSDRRAARPAGVASQAGGQPVSSEPRSGQRAARPEAGRAKPSGGRRASGTRGRRATADPAKGASAGAGDPAGRRRPPTVPGVDSAGDGTAGDAAARDGTGDVAAG